MIYTHRNNPGVLCHSLDHEKQKRSGGIRAFLPLLKMRQQIRFVLGGLSRPPWLCHPTVVGEWRDITQY